MVLSCEVSLLRLSTGLFLPWTEPRSETTRRDFLKQSVVHDSRRGELEIDSTWVISSRSKQNSNPESICLWLEAAVALHLIRSAHGDHLESSKRQMEPTWRVSDPSTEWFQLGTTELPHEPLVSWNSDKV